MNVNDPADPLLPPPHKGHHRSARERQRKGPMWGCLKTLVTFFGGTFLVLLLVIGGGWWYLGTTSFSDLVRLRIERTLEARMGREVSIRAVEIVRTRPQKVILHDLRIANAPGGVAPAFATVKRIEILGGIDSFWRRSVKVGRVDIHDPQLFFEVFPAGAPLAHNFPSWKTGPKRRFEMVRLDINKLFIHNGAFSFNDRKHKITAVASDIDSEVTVTRAQGLYAGVMTSPRLAVKIQEYKQFDLDLRGTFRYTPGKLALTSVALRGPGIAAFLNGELDPLTQGVYDLNLRSQLSLERVRDIFAVAKPLEGTLSLDTRLRGKQGDFRMTGGWVAPEIVADAYELTDAKGTLDITGNKLGLNIEKATYGGGTVSGKYALAQYAEPYPMTIDLRYDGISIEQLFNDWTIENTGIRAAATGNLTYRWNKDKILEGAGEGSARLAKNARAFSDARYPIPIAGATDFALDRGVVTFRNAELDTDASHISLNGTLKIEGAVTDLKTTIRSTDFSELDRIGYNFAHSAGKTDYELLGLGGAGTITASVQGPIDKPQLAANITGTGVRYNEVLLGDGDIALRYEGNRGALIFDRAVFTDRGGRMSLTGSVTFPESGPGPQFDIAVEANSYPAQRAVDAIGLELKIGEGLATGKMIIAGTPDSGRATFANLVVRRADATLALNGTVNWLPGEGNVSFDLDIAATNFPLDDIKAFLDFADLPASGKLTGTLKISGRKESLEGSGTITVREGSIMGEPVELASADITFTQGRMRAANVLVRSAAGEIRGEGEVDLTNKKFSYTIASSSIDLSRIELLSAIRDLLGGRIILESTGAGTFEKPELVVEATLEGATLRGLSLPEGSAPPSLYLAIRNGQLIVRGAIADIVTIEGEGTVGENLAVNGLVRVTITDLARALALSPATSSIPASGNLVLDLRLGGQLKPVEALIVGATLPVFNLKVAEHEFVAPEPPRITLRNGRIEIDSFVLQHTDSTFAVTGFAEISGDKRVDIDVRGRIEAALLQLFMADMRADGHADVAMSIDGAMANPRIAGTIELVDAEVKFAGFPQLIDEINGTLRFRGDRLEIEQVRATLGGGTVVAGGAVFLDGVKPTSMRITLHGEEVALRYYEGITVEGNFDLLLSGDFDRLMLTGDVAVTRALYFREFDLQQTLLNVILARNRVTPVATATWQDNVGLRLHLSAPGTLAVNNNIAEVTGSAELDVTGTLANPVVLGEVTLDEGGTVRIQNVDYRLVRGTIAFQNPFRIDPFFDVTIEGSVAGNISEIESGPLDLTVNITGTLDRITPTITSDPPASDITLFSILGIGSLGSTSAGQPGNAALAGQSLLYQSLSTALASRVLPFVDSFTYDPGLIDAGAGPGAKVTFEKRLSNDFRFLIVYNIDNNESKQVLEWLVNRSWTLQLTRDESDEYRLDARFRRRYNAHWEFGDEEEDNFAEAASIGASPSPAAGAAASPPPAVTAVSPHAFDGRIVEQIHFRADAGFDTLAVADDVTLKLGQPITIRDLQSSIKNLFSTGNFRDVRVDAAEGTAGAILTFALFLNYRVGEIEIEGLRGGERNTALRELTVRTGEVLSLDAVDDSAVAVEEWLRRNGYLEATVDPETGFNRARSVATVTFHVNAGPLARVGDIIIEGNTAPFTPERLIGRMRRRTGSAFRVRDARNDAQRMKEFLLRQDYRRADVEFLEHTYDPATHNVTLRYRASVGPKVRVEVAGVPRRSVRRLLPFRGRSDEYSEDAIDRAADRITTAMQQRGHYRASVDTESSLANGVETVTFHVSPGVRYRLAGVTFTGNVRVPDDDLRDIVQTAPGGGLRRIIGSIFRRPQGVTSTQLSDDRNAIESYYRLQGFSEATADTPAVVTNDAAGTMVVEFPVTEGTQTLVTDVRIEGNEKFITDALPELQLVRGGPFNPQSHREDVVALQTFYADRGHTEVQVAPRVEISEDRSAARVAYVITEGPRVNVDEVVVRGNTYTDRDVVLRTSDLDRGDPFSYSSILEAQRQLYRLGIFQRVDIQPEQAGTTVGDRDVVIQVEEGRNLTLTGAIGLRAQRPQTTGGGTSGTTTDGEPEGEPEEEEDDDDDEDDRFSERIALAVAHRNLFGTGRYLGVEAVWSRQEREFFLTYREPFVGRWDIPIQAQLYQSDDDTRPHTHIQQRGAKIEALRVARSRTRWSVLYEYRISECIDGDVCDLLRDKDTGEERPAPGLDRSLLNIEISSVAPTFFWDTRDDIIDPTRGFFTSATVEYAFPIASAEANFLKEYVQGAYYIPLSARQVIALSGRAGFIQPLGDTDDEDVPLSERFTAGGENTHRAFPLDLLGSLCRDPEEGSDCEQTLLQEEPNSPILPLGGSGLLLFNAEYRFPIFGTLGGALFVDAGNVYSTARVRFSDLKYGAGFGVRYLSPVGPLRVDIGWPINRRTYDRAFSWFVTLGYAF
jgi:outer membrane protein assembly factor BamA